MAFSEERVGFKNALEDMSPWDKGYAVAFIASIAILWSGFEYVAQALFIIASIIYAAPSFFAFMSSVSHPGTSQQARKKSQKARVRTAK